MKKIFITTALFLFVFNCFSQTQPKNIIIVVANGMGYSHYKALNLNKGESSILNQFDVTYGVTNYPSYWAPITDPKDVSKFKGEYHNKRVWTEFSYADSMKVDAASASSSIATGVKSAYKATAVDLDSTILETILERGTLIGKSTGIVTDLPFSHSGVASFAAHYPNIDSSTQIAEQLLIKSNLSVIIGQGNPNDDANLNPNYSFISQNDWNSAIQNDTVYVSGDTVTDINNDGKADSWSVLESQANFNTAINQAIPLERILGLPQNLSTISLTNKTKLALNTLNQDQDGFILVVETGQIDSASHSNNKAKLIESLQNLDTTVTDLYNWVNTNSSWDETLIIVVGSYETGYLSGTTFSKTEAGPDFLTKSIHITTGTKDEIPEMKFNSTTPTNHVTPLFANGAGSELFADFADEEDFVYGKYINNSEIGQICFRLLPNPIQIVKKPKNIILMINDGCGYNQIQAANYYTGKTQAYQTFPVKLFHSTYPIITDENAVNVGSWNNSYQPYLAWTDSLYFRNRNNATCSGASGTAIASGTKTFYYGLGVDIHRNGLNTIAHYAKTLNKSVGVASNIPFSDATPAVFFANNVSRNNAAEISRQMIIESDCDLIIGAGHPEYDKHGLLKTTPSYTSIGGTEFWEDLIAEKTTFRTPTNSGWTEVQDIDNDGTPDPWTIIQDSSEFSQMITGATPKRLFGIIKVESSTQFYRTGINAQEVHFDDINPKMPALWQIAKLSLHNLNNNPNGFFVMIEGDAGDNAGHQNQKGRLIEEQIAFNTAVDTVISWIEQNGGWDENLLIITADHETGLLVNPDFETEANLLKHYDIGDNGTGNIPTMKFFATAHSNQLIPLFAKGAGSEMFFNYADERDIVRGNYLNNSEIGQAMFTIWDGHPCTIINNRPVIVSQIPTVNLYINRDTTFTISTNFVTDFEDTELKYTVTSRPKWLTFDAATMSFTGTPDAIGNYVVKVITTDGATTGAGISTETTFNVLVGALVSLIDSKKPKIETYPNPASSIVNITLDNPEGEIIISNSNGEILEKRIISNIIESFNTSMYSSGIYMIEINTNNNKIIKKLVITN